MPLLFAQSLPKLIAHLESRKVTAIATGDEFSVAVDEHGLPWVWGQSEHGQVRKCVGGVT